MGNYHHAVAGARGIAPFRRRDQSSLGGPPGDGAFRQEKRRKSMPLRRNVSIYVSTTGCPLAQAPGGGGSAFADFQSEIAHFAIER